ncbi:MAG: alpha/beta fold hydrolase [Caldimonas sp.]
MATLLVLTLTAVALGLVLGLPWLPLAWVAIVLLGYTGMLAIEFAWLRGSYAINDPTRPRLAELVRAWATEVAAAPRVFLWRQPFRSLSEPDHLPTPARGHRGVLFVHGFFCNRGIWNRSLRLLRRDNVPFVAINLEPIFGSIDGHGPTIAGAVALLQRATGLAPVVVAHSMGGLAVRAWLAKQPDSPVHHVVTIASPHAGTRLGAGRRVRGANILQMRVGSDWLAQLSQSESAASRAHFTCFWSHCDNIVFPTCSATLPGADNRHLAVTPHVHMVDHPAVLKEVLRIVAKTS